MVHTPSSTLSNGNAVSTVYETEATLDSGAVVTGAPSSAINSSSGRTGAIVGGVVGGVIGLAALLVLCLLLYRRWKRKRTFSEFDGDFAPDRVERSMSQVKPFSGRNHKSHDRDLPTLPSIPVEDTTVPHYTDDHTVVPSPPQSPNGRYSIYNPPSSPISENHTHSSHSMSHHQHQHHYPYQNDFSHPSPGPSLVPLTATNTGGAPSFVSSLDMMYSSQPPPPLPQQQHQLHQPQPQRDLPFPTSASYPVSPPRSPPLHAYTGPTAGMIDNRLSDSEEENGSGESGEGARRRRLSVVNPDFEEGEHEEQDEKKSGSGSGSDEGVVYAGGYDEDARQAYLAGGPGVSRRSDS
ncbi:hypothetical protein AAF712_007722 [Marasmius tenuissimus]|uniref:Uncharacterized protein n=1 Tax=Marasmius tenuissimus TaxID=585030 RepID=A0ABR2ZVJ0_9AGAR